LERFERLITFVWNRFRIPSFARIDEAIFRVGVSRLAILRQT
jgi:hypothetical protein